MAKVRKINAPSGCLAMLLLVSFLVDVVIAYPVRFYLAEDNGKYTHR